LATTEDNTTSDCDRCTYKGNQSDCGSSSAERRSLLILVDSLHINVDQQGLVHEPSLVVKHEV